MRVLLFLVIQNPARIREGGAWVGCCEPRFFFAISATTSSQKDRKSRNMKKTEPDKGVFNPIPPHPTPTTPDQLARLSVQLSFLVHLPSYLRALCFAAHAAYVSARKTKLQLTPPSPRPHRRNGLHHTLHRHFPQLTPSVLCVAPAAKAPPPPPATI